MDFMQNVPLHIVAALKRPDDDTPITVNSVTLSPEDCQDILTYLSYHRQRNIKPAHVGNIADMMLNGEFAPGSMLTFALDENNQQVLVDGQHRLQAAVSADWTGDWTIRCLWHPGYTAYHIYTVLDTAQAQRTAAVIGRAAGYDQLSNRPQNAVIAAARYQNVWRTEYSLPPFCSNPPVRDNIARANERILAFEKADQIIHDNRATSHVKRRLAVPMVLATMSETLHQSPWEAADFWHRVATNGDGTAGELRNTLIQGRPPKSSAYYIARVTANAWNQRKSTAKFRRDNRNLIPLDTTSFIVPV